jgi:hypothetical protein
LALLELLEINSFGLSGLVLRNVACSGAAHLFEFGFWQRTSRDFCFWIRRFGATDQQDQAEH